MIEDHEQIEELLAGYVLRSLSGEDAAEADRLLSDHVPACGRCRDTLTDFQSLSADLALDTPPLAPPETLLPRLHRELGPMPRRRRTGQLVAVAASVALVAGLAGTSLTQFVRAGDRQARADDMAAALDLARQPEADLVPVGPATEISAPGSEEFYLYGHGRPGAALGLRLPGVARVEHGHHVRWRASLRGRRRLPRRAVRPERVRRISS